MSTTITFADKPTIDVYKEGSKEALEILTSLNADPYGKIKRYGIKIAKNNSDPNTRMTYMYDAVGMKPAKMNYSANVFDYGDWADAWFIKKNKPVMLKSDGTEDYELNPDDYSKKTDGTASDYNNVTYDGNVMARIPLVYVSMSEDDSYEYITVCNMKFDDTYKAIAHTKEDGSIVDNIYLACFRGDIVNDKARSLYGRNSVDTYTITQWSSYSTANGSGWNIGTWAQRMLINSLLWIIGKSDNTQAVFGQGNTRSLNNSTGGGANSSYNYMIDTGILYNKGQFYGYSDEYHQVKVFHIEGWWGDRYNFIHGIMTLSSSVKVSLTGPYNYTGDGYTTVSGPIMNSQQFATTTMTNEYGRFATTTGGSDSTYICDQQWYRGSGTYFAVVGGYCFSRSNCGASLVYVSCTSSESNWYFGASLSFV